MTHETEASPASRLREVALLFLRLGTIAFGGPAAHVAIMHDEVVRRRKWVNEQRFLDLIGATNLIPGPNSTEMAIHLGYLRAGWRGLILGGACFILPAMLIVTALAWVYVTYGSTPQADNLLYGVKPVVIAIIGQALWSLGRKAIRSKLTLLVGVAVVVLYFFGINPLLLLLAGGLTVMLVTNSDQLRRLSLPAAMPFLPFILAAQSKLTFSLGALFFTFLKIGSVLYGSGYVLLAFLQSDFVDRYGWLTQQQLLDAVAIGQVTPGPVFTTATFIGYLLGDLPGALVATLGIFLPSFIFVLLSNPLIPRLRASAWFGALLDGVNATSLGLMAAVTWELGQAALVDPLTISLAVAAALLLLRWQVNSTWLIASGAVIGLLHAFL
jgi:chromate transporter